MGGNDGVGGEHRGCGRVGGANSLLANICASLITACPIASGIRTS